MEAVLSVQLVSDADHVALSRLVVEISWRIDHGQADTVWELLVPDGVLVRQRHFVIFDVTGVTARPPRDHAGLCRRPMMVRWPLATA